MALYIRDESVDDLAKQVVAATGAVNKTEAVRDALKAQLIAAREVKSLRERIREVRELADTIGKPAQDFNMKEFSDELWGDT